MTRIFINYRRADSAAYTGRIYDRLVAQYGRKRVFMDVSSLCPGVDFIEEIEKSVNGCNIFIAVIGPQWLSITDSQGIRRLDSSEDYVRLEISMALKSQIPVIPVLVAKAIMPRSEDLPEALIAFARKHALEVSDDRFAYDVGRLLSAINDLRKNDSNATKIPVVILVQSKGRKFKAELPIHIELRRLISPLINRLGLPAESQDGRPVTYTFYSETQQRPLNSVLTLDQNGVEANDVLSLILQMVAGGPIRSVK
ncbi:MAG: TIR domain-containing protein [Chloroflexi bacterium]|nr:TIR domain-containing protein [Chloroflexota bacterium]